MPNAMAHIDLSRAADCIVVAPASADFLARVAHGLADDLLTTMVPAGLPLLVAPAMNRQMGESSHPKERHPVAGRASRIFWPGLRRAGLRRDGAGRMLEPEILEEVIAFFTPKLLAGRRC